MEYLPIALIAIGVGAAIYFLVIRKSTTNTPPAPQPLTPPGVWTILYSTGMPPTLTNNSTFAFPSAPNSVHCVVVNMEHMAQSRMDFSYNITADSGTKFVSTQDPSQPGYITMYLQRRGDNLSGSGAYASYRFYCQPKSTPLAAGNFTISSYFDNSYWTNVLGQIDPTGLQACLADLAEVGVVFGNPAIGATAHGVQVQGGNATFTITGFALI